MKASEWHKLTPLLAALLLAACGGDGGDNGGGGETPPAATGFSEETKAWTFALPGEGDALCYDFDLGEESACDTSSAWDLKIDGNRRFWTNGGVSGNGEGAAFGLLDWTALLGWTNATTDPSTGTDISAHYFEDSASSVFTESSWYAYNLQGAHQLYPNYRVYLIDADPADDSTPVYALQVIGYYGGDGGTTSGHPTIRWIDRADPDTVMTQEFDASNYDNWVYVDLATGDALDLDEASAAESQAWQIALRRSELKLNGGSSGSGSAAGYLGKTPEGFYDEEGEPVTEVFTSATPADTLAALSADDISEPANVNAWVTDGISSVLNPDYTGSYPGDLDYGWYVYTPTTHFISANPDNGALLRSGGGDSYARYHVTDISYADSSSPSSQTTWTLEFNVQAAEE